MPTYEYYCSKCETSFDKILKISERELPTQECCPTCNANNCIELTIQGAALLSPFRIDGLKKPRSDFKDRMQQIKQLSGKGTTIKDY
jgi:putative FmdB family regulatory protein